MAKARFGEMVRRARLESGLSLRETAARARLDFSRLSRIERGSRPAPGLAELRPLAELLGLDLADLLVAGGTPRELVEHLLWSERLREGEEVPSLRSYRPEGLPLGAKNTFRVHVLERDGALCTVRLGEERITVLSFAPDEELRIEIPPEAVLVYQEVPEGRYGGAENVFQTSVKKRRRLGQVTNLVLAAAGFELNTLHTERGLAAVEAEEKDRVMAAVQATAIRTAPFKEETE